MTGPPPRSLAAMRSRAAICLALTALWLAVAAGAPTERAAGFEAEVRRTAVGRTHIAWYERGHGPPLLLLTGTGSTMSEWDPALLRMLARRHRLILFDYPGVGRSGPWHGHEFGSLADAVAGLMAAISVPRAAVLGWSMGGFVAQRLAIEHPGRVSHLILAGTNPGGRGAVLGSPTEQAVDSDPDPSTAAILHELYPPHRQREGRRFLRRLVRASASREIPDDFRVATSTVRRQVAAEEPWLSSDRNYRQLGRLEIRVLAAAGARDQIVPPTNLRRIATRAPAGSLRIFAGAHAFLFQQRRPFVKVLEHFLGD